MSVSVKIRHFKINDPCVVTYLSFLVDLCLFICGSFNGNISRSGYALSNGRTIYHHPVICLTTGPKPPPKRCLHIVRSRASSFKWEYPLMSLRSSSSFLRLLPRLLVTSFSPFIYPSITCFRRQPSVFLFHVGQRFSNFFQVGTTFISQNVLRTTFISQNVLRTTLLLGLSNSLGLP